MSTPHTFKLRVGEVVRTFTSPKRLNDETARIAWVKLVNACRDLYKDPDISRQSRFYTESRISLLSTLLAESHGERAGWWRHHAEIRE